MADDNGFPCLPHDRAIDASKAKRFREQAEAGGLLLKKASETRESRFTFELRRGAIVTTKHPSQIVKLLAIAKNVWGDQGGEYLELLAACAPRQDLDSSAPPENVTWKVVPETPQTTMLKNWLKDQYLLAQATKLPGLP